MKAVTCATIALMIGAVAPVAAQVPPPQLAKPAGQAGPRPASIPGVSPAGNAVVTKMGSKPDPVMQQLVGQLKGVLTQLAEAAQSPTVDVDRLAGLLKQREGIQAQLNTHNDDRVIAVLRAMPAADRAPFLKALSEARPAGR